IDEHGALIHERAAEMAGVHHRPGIPGGVVPAAKIQVDRDDRAIVESERAPAHVAWRIRPRDISRRPPVAGDPEPRAGGEAPAAEMVRGPREEIETDPRPPVPRIRDPAAVVIRTPSTGHARIPDVAIRLGVAPVAVLIELRCIRLHRCGAILARHAETHVAPRL